MADKTGFIVTCYGCWKKLYVPVRSKNRQVARCKACGEMFYAFEDGHPERMVELWFSKMKQFEGTTIERVRHFIDRSSKSLDVAVYSLTHDWLIDPFRKAHERGVAVRILVDNCQANVKGSDFQTYADMGIQVARDVKSGFMHHKFAIRDGKAVLTGSYNWTKSAEDKHRENFMIVHYPHAVEAYEAEFEKLWDANKNGIVRPEERLEADFVASPV